MRAALAVALVLACACGDNLVPGAPDALPADVETCDQAPGTGVSFDPAAEPCRVLSSHRFFSDGPAQQPNARVVPYDVNTPLFSDYASKHRFIWLPEGESIQYTDTGVLEFPPGTVLIKTFSFLADLRDPDGDERIIETRLMVLRDSGWDPVVYVWNDEQTDAFLQKAGGLIDVEWTHTDGADRQLRYIVPNTNQCIGCHENSDVVSPIGPQARHLNRDLDFGAGPENQLSHLVDVGYLIGAPADPATGAPKLPVFDDPSTGTVEERARAWLDINCAHCHNPGGPARTSGLDLRTVQTNPVEFGVCKTPVAAGRGSGGLQYNIVPGAPDESILVFRLEATEPELRMPELLRQTVHTESLELVRSWIASLQGSCGE